MLLDALFVIARLRQVQIVGLLAKPDGPRELFGVDVLGDDDEIERVVRENEPNSFVVGLGMTRGGNPLRENAFALGRRHGLEPFTVIHPSATVSPRAEIAAGACVLAGAVVQPRACIGVNVIINTGAGIDHDCTIGEHSHIAPGATLSGNVNVGRTVLIGAGASVRQGISIGDNATIGSGAALVSDCRAGDTMTGVPARVTEKTRLD